MMRDRRLVVVAIVVVALGVLLPACDEGVVLEVHPAPGVATDKVQLYIGLGVCDDCPGIQPPLAPELLPGTVFFREAASPDVREAIVENGVARFRIEASAVADRFDLAVAVDANGRSAAVIQNLSLAGAARYRVDLLPASDRLGIKPATAEGNFVALWKQPVGPLPCMGFERWSGGQLAGERIFIVPEADLDCDGRTAMTECAPYGYDAVGIPALADTTCTTPAPIAPNAVACKLGGPSCDEATNTPRACAPTEYCLPSAYCDVANVACAFPPDRDRCLFDSPALATAGATLLDCTVPFRRASDGSHDEVCDTGTLAKFNIRPLSGATAATLACVGPDRDFFLRRPSPGDELAFTDTVKRTTHDEANKEWIVETHMHDEGNCNYKLELHGNKALEATKPDPEATFAQFWVTQNGGGLRKLLVPIALRYVDDCSAPAKCTLVVEGSDSIASCLR